MEWVGCFLEWKENVAETGRSKFSFGFEIKEPIWVTHYIQPLLLCQPIFCLLCLSIGFPFKEIYFQLSLQFLGINSQLGKSFVGGTAYAAQFQVILYCVAVSIILFAWVFLLLICLLFKEKLKKNPYLHFKGRVKLCLWDATSLERKINNMLCAQEVGSWEILGLLSPVYIM